MSFFLNDTGTSEIYTNSHALALRDALPLCADGDARHEGGPVARDPRPREGSASAIHRREPRQDARAIRSAEHTSELQSLMRNSYAVFCLKTKNMQRDTANRALTLTMVQDT